MREMPTAAKLVAAICFLGVGAVAAWFLWGHLPDGYRPRYFIPVCAGLGAVVGWRVMGRMVGYSLGNAALNGLATSIALVFWALLLFALREMLMRATHKRYGGLTDALTNIIVILYDEVALLLAPDVVLALVVGGMLGGVVTELASRRWP
jgi:hypothetical protein